MAQVIDTMDLNSAAAMVDSLYPAKGKFRETTKGLSKEQKEEREKLRVSALSSAQSLIFGIFDKKIGGGDMVGAAGKRCLKIANGGKSVKARTVTETMIADISTDSMLESLRSIRSERENTIAETCTFRETHNYTAVEVSAYRKSATDALAKNYQMAEEWINRAWARIPSAMAIIRAAGDGTVVALDMPERKPVALAFEQVLLNRAETARQFCKAMGY